MEITQDELLEQSKISALESGLYKTRLSKATILYENLYEAAKHSIDLANIEDPNIDFEFLNKFPAKIEF